MPNLLHDQLVGSGDGDALFLVHGSEVLTYRALRSLVARLAGVLQAMGVQPGDRVAAQIEKSPQGLLLYLATVHAGAVFLPLNPAYTGSELAYFVTDAEPALVVCEPSAVTGVQSVAGEARIETLSATGAGSLADRLAASGDEAAPVQRDAADLAAVLYTSGTTGRSKGAMLTHGNLASNAATLAALWHFTAADRLLHALPIFHTHGLFTACNTVLRAGASLAFLPRFDVNAVLEVMPETTVMMGVPTYYARLLGHPGLSREATAGMRLFVSGSAPLLADTHRAWRERTGHAILERYGMTETNMNCSNPYEGERRPGSVGFPLPDVELRIADAEGREVPHGEIGTIEVRGPNVCAGYWRNPDKTAADFRPDGFFVTGDLGLIDADGYVHISGRGKDLIISGGFNVYPKEVELAVDALPGVVESAVIGLPHADLGEAVTALIVSDGRLGEAAILERLDQLARYKRPKRVLFVPDLPRNAMGKVQKAALRESHRTLYA